MERCRLRRPAQSSAVLYITRSQDITRLRKLMVFSWSFTFTFRPTFVQYLFFCCDVCDQDKRHWQFQDIESFTAIFSLFLYTHSVVGIYLLGFTAAAYRYIAVSFVFFPAVPVVVEGYSRLPARSLRDPHKQFLPFGGVVGYPHLPQNERCSQSFSISEYSLLA